MAAAVSENDNPWDTEAERMLALNMGRALGRSDVVPALSSRVMKAASLRNVVGSACLSCAVDNKEVLRRFAPSYEPDFTSLVMRRTNPYNTVLQFSRGWIVVIGTNSANGTLLATHQQRISLAQLGQRPVLRYFSIDNLVVSGSVPFPVEISSYEDEACDVVYKPWLFPAMIFRFRNPNCTGLLFRGGSFMLVGMTRQEDLNIVNQHLLRILEMHSINMDASHVYEMSAAHASQGHCDILRARGGRGKRGADGDEMSAGPVEIHLLPTQRTELMRRVNERLNRDRVRGATAVSAVFEDEFKIMKRQILEERERKQRRAEERGQKPRKVQACEEEDDFNAEAEEAIRMAQVPM